MSLTIPNPHPSVFKNGIRHPDLYLWDAWSYYDEDTIHLYCLALNRTLDNGDLIDASNRNSYPFHIRHFFSSDNGESWKDEGCLLSATLGQGKHDSKTIWSGSIENLPSGEKLIAYTGLYQLDEDRTFLQNIALAMSKDGYTVNSRMEEPLSCPERDFDEISNLGYYVDPKARMGHKDGEGGGPIMAWRDPFIFIDSDGKIHLFWAAKVGTHSNAMAHAVLEKRKEMYGIKELFPPTTLPDGANFTQLELPKIYFDHIKECYYLFVSTCNRLYEGQSDEEVDKTIRLYKSKSLQGPWTPNGINGSALLQKEHLFGSTVLKPDFENNRLLCIGPYTDAAPNHLSLTFSKSFYIYLDPVEVQF